MAASGVAEMISRTSIEDDDNTRAALFWREEVRRRRGIPASGSSERSELAGGAKKRE
jgi:hypothetical protein